MTQTTLAQLAERLIAKNGRVVTLCRAARQPLNPEKPWLGTDCANDSTQVRAVILDYTEEDIDGSRIKRGDRRALVAALPTSLDFRQWDLLVDGETEFRIIAAEITQPGTVLILWEFQLRN